MLLLLAVLAGCGGGGLKLVPAAGTVTLDGKPVEGASVMFLSAEGGHVADGVTDAEGRFQLRTTNQPGAVAGDHRVTITKQIVHDPIYEGTAATGSLEIQWIVPEKYGQADTSGLTATVSSDQGEFAFELRSE